MISFRCPSCTSVYSSPPYPAGAPMDCPRCGQRFGVPRDPNPAAAAPDTPSNPFWLPAEESAVLAPRPQNHPPAAAANGPPRRQGRWWLWVAAGAGAAGLVVGFLLVLLLGGGRHDAVPPDPAPHAQAAEPGPAKQPEPKPPAEKNKDIPPTTGTVEPDKKPAEEPPERKSMDRLDRTKLDVVLPPVRKEDKTPAVWEGHTNHIRHVAFTSDGQFVVSVSGDFDKLARPADNSIRVWDARRGQQVHKLEGFDQALQGLAISPGGRFALFSHGGYWEGKNYLPAKTFGVFLWDIQAKRVLGPGADLNTPGPDQDSPGPRFLGLKEESFFTDFAPGRMDAVPPTVVACGARGGLILWETGTANTVFQRQVERVQGFFNGVRQVKFTPDGRYLVLAHSDHTLRVHRADTGEEVCPPLKSHDDRVLALDVGRAPDGSVRILSGGGGQQKRDGTGFEPGAKDHAIRLWDFERKEVFRLFEGHTNVVYAVAFCPDGRHFVSGGRDNTVRLWDVEAGRQVRVLGRHANAVRSVAVSPDGRACVSGGDDCKVRFWTIPDGGK